MATAIQTDIDIFINKAQKKMANLSHEIRDDSKLGKNVDEEIDLLQELKASVNLFQDDHYDLTDTKAMEVISYLNRKAELTILPFAPFDSTCVNGNVAIPGGFIDGPQGEQGVQGIQGEQGEAGADGADGADGDDGTDGWSPIHAIVEDGERRVVQVTGWTGGTGTAPTSGLYLGDSGYVASIDDAIDIRGAIGETGETGATGATGATGTSYYTYVAYADNASGGGFTNTFDEEKNYIAIKVSSVAIPSPNASNFTGLWKNYKGEKGDPFVIDAQGSISDRSTYDAEAEGFTFMDNVNGVIYIKLSGLSGDWSNAFPFVGFNGWSPVHAIVPDGERLVLQIVNWVGGDEDATMPSVIDQYVGELGIVNTVEDAVDIRGPQGQRFFPDAEGDTAGRDAYDDEVEDFIYSDTEAGLVYIKLSDTTADWSDGFLWRGEQGPQGPVGESGFGITDACLVATTADLDATYSGGGQILTADVDGAITIDDVALAVSDRVLVKDQTNAEENGIYIVTIVGTGITPFILTRASDFNSTLKAQKFFQVFIEDGTVNGITKWGMTNSRPALVLDTTDLVFHQDKPSLSNYLPLDGSDSMTANLNFATNGLGIGWGSGSAITDTSGTIQFSGILDFQSSIVIFSGLTASTVPYLDASKNLVSSAVTPTQLGYLDATSSIQTQLDAKQATLVSATNIKTVNGSSLLGSGDLVVSGTIADADYGDVAVSSSGTVWTVQSATSPAITTSITTASTTFALVNTIATTVNFAGGASTALNIGNASGTNTVLGATTFSQGVTLNAATSDINSTTINLGGASSNLKVTTGGVTMLLSTGGGATANNGITFGRNASTSNTTGTNRLALASATWAPTSGSGAFVGIASNATINQTSSASGVAAMYDTNPTLTSVLGSVYGYRSQLAANPTGGGVAWNIFADGTASNVLVGLTKFGASTAPTSFVAIAAGVTGNAQINLAPGVAPSSPVDGDIYYINTSDRLMFFKNATACEVISASAVTTEAVVSDTTLTVTYNGTTYKILARA
jgi:hypothetical protein